MLCNSFPVSWFQDRLPTSKLAKRPGKKISKIHDGANNFIRRIEMNSHQMWSLWKTMKELEMRRSATKMEEMKMRESLKDK